MGTTMPRPWTVTSYLGTFSRPTVKLKDRPEVSIRRRGRTCLSVPTPDDPPGFTDRRKRLLQPDSAAVSLYPHDGLCDPTEQILNHQREHRRYQEAISQNGLESCV